MPPTNKTHFWDPQRFLTKIPIKSRGKYLFALKKHLFICCNGESEVQETRIWHRKKKRETKSWKAKTERIKETSGDIGSENRPTGNRNQKMEDLCD